MKFSLFGRLTMALFASATLGLGMTACGGGTIGYMWVLGQQYNQIAGFKIDDYTGNLTQIVGSPFSTNGSMPVSILVKPGGRYVYVINQGTGGGVVTNASTGLTQVTPGVGQSVSLFAVGGDGTLTFQQKYVTQGAVSMWAQFDNTGAYLYVLDKYGPNYVSQTNPGGDLNGAITAFSTDPSTGRLTLITNSQTKINNVNTTAFEVGQNPIMMKEFGGCLFTVNSTGNTVSPFTFGAGGQLAFTTTQTLPTQASNLTSINAGGQFVYLTDAGSNQVLQFSTGSTCNLTATVGNRTPNYGNAVGPQYVFVDNTGNFVYLLNSNNTNTGGTQNFSTITGFYAGGTNNQLTPLDTTPYAVGSGPTCMVEDPTGKYMYISTHFDGSVTGKTFDPTHGFLSDLKRGSTFPATGLAGCLVESGVVSN